jgi:hypothetical protein
MTLRSFFTARIYLDAPPAPSSHQGSVFITRSSEAIIDLTRQVRAHLAARQPTKRGRGRTTTPKERAAAERGTKLLKKRGSKAVVKVRATKPGAPSAFDVVGLTEAEVAAMLTKA